MNGFGGLAASAQPLAEGSTRIHLFAEVPLALIHSRMTAAQEFPRVPFNSK
jgi:hypothetical protein